MPTTGVVVFLLPFVYVTNLAVNLIEGRGLSIYGGAYDLDWVGFVTRLGIVVVLGLFCHWVYFGGGPRNQDPEAGLRSLVASLVFLVVVGGADQVLIVRGLFLSTLQLVISVAIVSDLVSEASFRWRYGELTPVAWLHRLADLPRRTEDLRRATIPAMVRGRYHRAMLQFFGPFVPIEIMVPVGRGEEALRAMDADRTATRVSSSQYEEQSEC